MNIFYLVYDPEHNTYYNILQYNTVSDSVI